MTTPVKFPDGLERRAGLEVRAAPGRRLVGIAAPFNSETRIGGPSLQGSRRRSSTARSRRPWRASDLTSSRSWITTPRGCWLGSHPVTLRLLEQRDGLAYDIALPATTLARPLALVERGDVEGMSFGFRPVKEDCRPADQGALVACDLVEISVIQAHAAYAATSVQARSADAQAQAAARWRRQFVDTL